MTPLAVIGTGMVTGVGYSTEASCAAIRVGITGFVETKFMYDGEFIQGCPVPFDTPYRGRRKLIEMAVFAIKEAVEPLLANDISSSSVPLLLCLSENERPGRLAGLDDSMLQEISERLEIKFHPSSTIISDGRVGGVTAIAKAEEILARDRHVHHVLVCGVDSYLVSGTLSHFHEQRRLLTADNSDGFIPGEAACAVLLKAVDENTDAAIAISGIGMGKEPAPINSEEPLRSDGLVEAIRQAMNQAGTTYAQLAYRLTDNSGEQYGYKDSALAMTRVLRTMKEKFNLEQVADCIGEVGAAVVPALVALAKIAEEKSYSPGQLIEDAVLCHVSGDGSSRRAFVLVSLKKSMSAHTETA